MEDLFKGQADAQHTDRSPKKTHLCRRFKNSITYNRTWFDPNISGLTWDPSFRLKSSLMVHIFCKNVSDSEVFLSVELSKGALLVDRGVAQCVLQVSSLQSLIRKFAALSFNWRVCVCVCVWYEYDDTSGV